MLDADAGSAGGGSGNMKKKRDKMISQFLKERRAAFTAFVMEDDFDAAVDYARKWGVETPRNINVFKIGMYKAVLDCTDIPEYVKVSAKLKLEALRKKLRGE